MAKPYQEAKSVLKLYLATRGYGQWIEKPPISDYLTAWRPVLWRQSELWSILGRKVWKFSHSLHLASAGIIVLDFYTPHIFKKHVTCCIVYVQTNSSMLNYGFSPYSYFCFGKWGWVKWKYNILCCSIRVTVTIPGVLSYPSVFVTVLFELSELFWLQPTNMFMFINLQTKMFFIICKVFVYITLWYFILQIWTFFTFYRCLHF